MTEGMADLLAAHAWPQYRTGTCMSCPHQYDFAAGPVVAKRLGRGDLRKQISAHQAEVLTAAGYGDTRSLTLSELDRLQAAAISRRIAAYRDVLQAWHSPQEQE